MWRRGIRAEKQTGNQPETCEPTIVARLVSAAIIKSAPLSEIPVGRNITVAAEKTPGALPEIGNDHDIGFIIAGARFDPRLPLAHIIGRSQICVSVSAPDLQTAEFVN